MDIRSTEGKWIKSSSGPAIVVGVSLKWYRDSAQVLPQMEGDHGQRSEPWAVM